MTPLDPRTTLVRDGTAALALEGLVPAARFQPTTPHACARPSAAIRKAPDAAAEQLDQLLFGEPFDVLETQGGFAFGQARRDGYVGWVEAATLAPAGAAPTHRVKALRTYGFSRPDIKSAPVGLFSMNALLTVGEAEGRFLDAGPAGWLIADHLAPVGEGFETDWAGVAERFLGAPYQWGGRESLGLDCSGLVQQALYACGRTCPRDSDMQRALGTPVTREALGRGDLAFWRGHVAVMLDAERIVHANGSHMQVAVEPLDEALARIAGAGGGEALGFRRL